MNLPDQIELRAVRMQHICHLSAAAAGDELRVRIRDLLSDNTARTEGLFQEIEALITQLVIWSDKHQEQTAPKATYTAGTNCP